MRLIAVVLGAETPEARTSGSQALLDYGFNAFETHKLYSAGQELTAARVWKGRPEITSLGLAQDLFVTIPRGRYEALSASMSLPSRLVAPLAESIEVGEVEVQLGGQDLSSVPLVSLREVAEAGLWTKVVDGIMLWMQ
jgi:D-alanyl-D-alanine carboxypeptidase (penicillin-binding protein 5/6)